MAFGLTTSSGSGDFAPQVRWDARAGRMHVVERVQGMAGWETQLNDVTASQPVFMIDFGSIQVGWLTFAPRPDFVTVPLGSPLPPRPSGTTNRASSCSCFRRRTSAASVSWQSPRKPCSVHWTRCTLPIWQHRSRSGDDAGGATDRHAAGTTRGPQGNITNYSPQLVIVAWAPRPEELGPVTAGSVPPPPLPPATAAAARPMAAPPTPPPAPPQAAPQAAPGNGAAMPWDGRRRQQPL